MNSASKRRIPWVLFAHFNDDIWQPFLFSTRFPLQLFYRKTGNLCWKKAGKQSTEICIFIWIVLVIFFLLFCSFLLWYNNLGGLTINLTLIWAKRSCIFKEWRDARSALASMNLFWCAWFFFRITAVMIKMVEGP